eukprot:gene640-biopygen1257
MLFQHSSPLALRVERCDTARLLPLCLLLGRQRLSRRDCGALMHKSLIAVWVQCTLTPQLLHTRALGLLSLERVQGEEHCRISEDISLPAKFTVQRCQQSALCSAASKVQSAALPTKCVSTVRRCQKSAQCGAACKMYRAALPAKCTVRRCQQSAPCGAASNVRSSANCSAAVAPFPPAKGAPLATRFTQLTDLLWHPFRW